MDTRRFHSHLSVAFFKNVIAVSEAIITQRIRTRTNQKQWLF